MKKIIYIILVLVFGGNAMAQQLSLQCPPCLPVNGCNQCWTSIEEAQNSGCSSTARYVDPINDDEEKDQLILQILRANTIYPNPSFDGFFTLENANGFSGKLEVVDPLGRVVLRYTLENKKRFRFQESLQSGLYILTIHGKNGIAATKKLLVR